MACCPLLTAMTCTSSSANVSSITRWIVTLSSASKSLWGMDLSRVNGAVREVNHDTVPGVFMAFVTTPVRRAVVTSLDVLVGVLAGIGLLMALGAHTRVLVGATVISAESAWRPFAAAAACLLLRVAVGRRLRPLPSLADPSLHARLEAERRWLAEPARLPRAGRYYAAGVAIVSLLWFAPHLAHIRRVPDAGDPLFSAWRIARVAHQLTHDPLHLFDGNIFYPEPYTLTYSDATVLEGFVATPFIVAGLDPLVVSNAIFLSAFPLCGLAFFYTGWRLTADLRAGFVAGVLGALYPFHLEHYSHFELQFSCFVPLAVLALLRLLAAPHWTRGATLGALLALQWLACMYFGVMLPVFLLPVALFAIVAWRVRPSADLIVSFGVAALVAAVGFSMLGIPYMKSRSARGERDPRIVTFYSALPSDYGHAHLRLASYRWIPRDENKAERELFPGISPAGARPDWHAAAHPCGSDRDDRRNGPRVRWIARKRRARLRRPLSLPRAVPRHARPGPFQRAGGLWAGAARRLRSETADQSPDGSSRPDDGLRGAGGGHSDRSPPGPGAARLPRAHPFDLRRGQ